MKLYVSDLDGTLLNKDKIITEESKNFLNKAIDNNVLFTIATARTPATVVDILDGVNLKIPAVMMNGVIVYDINEKRYVDIKKLDNEIVEKVLKIFDYNNIGSFVYTIKNDHLYVYYKDFKNLQEEDFYNERCNRKQKTFKKVDKFCHAINGDDVINFIIFDTYDNIKIVYDQIKEIKNLNVDFYKDIYGEDDSYYLEAYSSSASKANGIEFLGKYIGNVDIICFGDNLNDIPMFKIADTAIAVNNASDQLKEIATEVIGSNNEDSVAKYIISKEFNIL